MTDLRVSPRAETIGWRGVTFECTKCGLLDIPIAEMLAEPDERPVNCGCGRRFFMVARSVRGYQFWEVDTVGEVRAKFAHLLNSDEGTGGLQ